MKMTQTDTMSKSGQARRLLLAAATALGSLAAMAAEQTTVAHWEFTTGYDEVKNGNTVTYTPDNSGWAASANQKWSDMRPCFLPNSCALTPDDCKVTLHTSDGKWQLTSSGSTPNYLLRLNTASITRFTSPDDYADATKHDQYFEVSMPTTALSNVKLNFSIGDGSSSSTRFGVVYSVDGGTTWTRLQDYTAASHWNKYEDAVYTLEADNKESLIVRMLIQSATKTSNYNLKYLNIIADDFQAPVLERIIPADGETDVVPSGKIALLFNESVKAVGNAAGVLTNNATKASQQILPVINNTRVTYEFDNLDLSASYTFTVPANSFSDMAGNVCAVPCITTFTTSASRPVPPPVLDSKTACGTTVRQPTGRKPSPSATVVSEPW